MEGQGRGSSYRACKFPRQNEISSDLPVRCLALLYLLQSLVDALALLSLSFCPSRTQTDSERMPPRFRVIDSGVASVPLIGSLPPCQSDRRRLIIINARESGRTGILQGLVAESALERNAISIINLQSTGQAYKVCYRKTCKR